MVDGDEIVGWCESEYDFQHLVGRVLGEVVDADSQAVSAADLSGVFLDVADYGFEVFVVEDEVDAACPVVVRAFGMPGRLSIFSCSSWRETFSEKWSPKK